MALTYIVGCDCPICQEAKALGALGVNQYDPLLTIDMVPKKKVSLEREYAHLCETPVDKITTQKARGVRALLNSRYQPGPGVEGPGHPYQVWVLPHNTLPKKFPGDEYTGNAVEYFARPCPVTPRHGFVESRGIASPAEAERLYREGVLPEDPQGEVIVMPRLSGEFSAVATSAGVTWGLGNDGATGIGKNNVMIPTYTTSAMRWNDYITRFTGKNSTALGIKKLAYMELVFDKDIMRVVQLRDGPEQPAAEDYIPVRTEVKKVIVVKEMELLTWEKFLKEEKRQMPEGLVLQYRDGSLSSHYAVHGIELHIPIITTRFVTVGEVLEPIGLIPPRLTKKDTKRIALRVRHWLRAEYIRWKPVKGREGIDYERGEDYSYRYARDVIATAVATVHAMSQWDNSQHLLDLRAQAVVSLTRFIMSAGLGELRHWGSNGPGRESWKKNRKRLTKMHDLGFNGGRESIYLKALMPHSLRQMRTILSTVNRDFLCPGWGGTRNRRGKTSYGYGGPNWANVALQGLNLTRALEKFLKTPTPLKWAGVTMAANLAVHTVHNGGFAMNKWVNNDDFKRIANTPGCGFLNAHAGRFVLGLDDETTKGAW